MSSQRSRNRLAIASDEPRGRAGAAAVDSPRPGDAGRLFTTGDMARITNTTLRTVRFYEEAGILRPARRTDGGHRLFAPEELDRLRLVSDMREAGMSLDDIRALLDLRSKASTGGEAARLATTALKDVVASLRAKVEVLERLAGDLESTVQHAEACVGCDRTELFPHRCDECEKLLLDGAVPRGLRVLWGMPEERAAEPRATSGDGGGVDVEARGG